MSARAYVEIDPMRLGLKLALVREGAGTVQTYLWDSVTIKAEASEQAASSAPGENVWLRLPDDDARAIYEALADHFGHAGHDIRSLRKDYDSERARVDRLINNLISGGAS